MNELISSIFIAAITIWIYMSLWFVVSVMIKRNDVADAAWGLGFVVTSLVVLISTHHISITDIVVFLMVLIWGLRLAIHIGTRNLKKPEDFRYKTYRDNWGKWFYLRSYLQIYMLQGFLMLIILLPVLTIFSYIKNGVSPLLIIGSVIWIFGFVFESVGDRQLKNFLKYRKVKGTVMQDGLWKYSRHPNYFGEITQWWGIGIIALSTSYGWLSIIGPVTITFLIVKVSGIPMLESKYKSNPDYIKYKQRTSMLIPLPIKNI